MAKNNKIIITEPEISADNIAALLDDESNNSVMFSPDDGFTAVSGDLAISENNDSVTVTKGNAVAAEGLDFGDGDNTLSLETYASKPYKDRTKIYPTEMSATSLSFGRGKDKISLASRAELVAETIDTGKGNDTVTLADRAFLTVTGEDGMLLGEGNDSLSVGANSTARIAGTLDFGKGSDKLQLNGIMVAGNITGLESVSGNGTDLLTGEEIDQATLAKLQKSKLAVGVVNEDGDIAFDEKKANNVTAYSLETGANIIFGKKNDKVTISQEGDVTVGNVALGEGNDSITLAKDAYFRAGTVEFGDGNDTLSVASGSELETAALDLGSGNDTITVAQQANVYTGTLDFGYGNDRMTLNGVVECVSLSNLESLSGNGTLVMTDADAVDEDQLKILTKSNVAVGVVSDGTLKFVGGKVDELSSANHSVTWSDLDFSEYDVEFGKGNDRVTVSAPHSKKDYTDVKSLDFGNGRNALIVSSKAHMEVLGEKGLTFGIGSDNVSVASRAQLSVNGNVNLGGGNDTLSVAANSELLVGGAVDMADGSLVLNGFMMADSISEIAKASGNGTLILANAPEDDSPDKRVLDKSNISVATLVDGSIDFDDKKHSLSWYDVQLGADINFGIGDDSLTAGRYLTAGAIDFNEGRNTLSVASTAVADIGAVNFGGDNDKVTLAANAELSVDGDIAFGDGSNTLSLGSSAKAAISGAVDFGDGKNTLSIGSKSEFEVAGEITFADGNDTASFAADSKSRFASLDFGDGDDRMTIARSSFVQLGGALDFGDGTDALVLNGRLDCESISGLSKVSGNGVLCITEISESNRKMFEKAGITVITANA